MAQYAPKTWTTGETILATELNAIEAAAAAAIPKADADAAYDAKGAATAAQAAAVQRANHTGTQSADTVVDGTTNKAYTATEKTKLAGVATGATANATDAQLRDRSTHTGTQAIGTVTGLQTALDAKLDAATAASTYVTQANAIDLESTQDSIAGMFTGGTHSGISFAYDDPNGHINATVTPGAVADATTTSKGAVQLAGDLAGTAAAPTVAKIGGVTPATVATSGSYTDLTNKPTIPAAYTDEQAQDAAASLFTTGTHTGISFTYNDAGNSISATVSGGGAGSALASGWYGTGEDGDVTISTNTTISRNMYYNNLTVNTGVKLTTNGYQVFVKGTCTLNGEIGCEVIAQGTGNSPFSSSLAGGFYGTTSARTASTTGAGTQAPNINDCVAGSGGAGGAASGGATAGGAARTASPGPTLSNNSACRAIRSVLGLLNGMHTDPPFWATRLGQGIAGSSGAGDGTNVGGSGGQGGGYCLVAAYKCTGTGVVSAKGSSGAHSAGGNAGGGGGGGGGVVGVFTTTLPCPWTLDASGGAAGNGTGTGAAGTAGSAGYAAVIGA